MSLPLLVQNVFALLGSPAVLLPIPEGSKKPVDRGWTEFSLSLMEDPAYLSRFQNGCNVGVLLGKNSNDICTIDIDDDRFIEDFLKFNPRLRSTLRTKRLKGGNFWLKVKGDYPGVIKLFHSRMKDKKGAPISIGEWRSTGGQTVIHGTAGGIQYQVLVPAKPIEIEFSEIHWPDWISNPPMLDVPEDITQGERKSSCLDISKLENYTPHDNGSAHAACPACRAHNQDADGNHLFIRANGKFGCCCFIRDKDHRQLIWKLAGTPTEKRDDPFYDLPTEPGPNLPEIVDSASFVQIEYHQPAQIIKGLLHKGSKLVIGGGSKSFKTWVQLHMALCVAYHLDWLGFPTTPGRVLFVNFEIQKEFFQERIKTLASALSLTLEEGRLDIWNLRGKSAPYNLIVPKIIARIKELDYVLSILDPVYKLYGKTDENSASDVAQLLNSFESLTVDTGSAVGFGAHYSKGNQASKESIDRVSGSGVFARDPDSIINFTKHEEQDAFVVEPILRNLPPVEPFVVRWQFPLMVRDDDLDPAALKKSAAGRPSEFKLDDLWQLLQEPQSTHEWRKAADQELGISKATFYRMKDTLFSQKRILLSKVHSKWVQVFPSQPQP